VKSLIFKKKNLIAVAMAAVVAVAGFGAYRAQAAGKIDENKKCTITITVPETYTASDQSSISNLITKYNGMITVNLYKVADIDAGGNIESAITGLDFSDLQKDDVTVEKVKELANSAYDKIDKEANHPTVQFNPIDKKSEPIDIERGLYLYVLEPCKNDRYKFTSDKYLVAVPSSNYIGQSTKVDENGNVVKTDSSDDWNYDVTIALKTFAEERKGDLVIEKTLTTFDESLGTADFVYSVVAKLDGKTVHNNVYTISFNGAGTQSIKIEDIPATAEVTVTEVYSGASYTLKTDNTVTATIVAKDAVNAEHPEAKASFTNDFDNHLIVGGISVTNEFTYDENGNIKWNKYNGTKTEEVPQAESTGGDN